MRWLVNAGTCDFWHDNWLDSGALYLRTPVNGALTFKDFIRDGRWDSLVLAQYFPSDIMALILQHPTPEGERPDEVVWMPTPSGQFSLSSAFQEVRQARNASWLFSRIWHPQIPLKVSFFMLRLLRGRLPLDDILGKFGIQGPSKCFCCSLSEGESIEHIFAQGQLAKAVWDFFGATCGLFLSQVPLRDTLVAWWLSSQSDVHKRLVVDILPSFICWHVWKARNKAVWEGVHLSCGEVCRAILRDVSEVVAGKFGKVTVALTFNQFLDQISAHRPIQRCRLVRWHAPSGGFMLLNTDGCSKGNPGPSGGGGVLRDSAGQVLVGYSAFLGVNTSLRAEALALLTGLRLCVHKGYTQVRVQSDSLVLVGILQRRFQCPWHIRREVAHIWQIVDDPGLFSHCFREANKVADILANEGLLHPQVPVTVYDQAHNLPQLAKGEVRMDKLGFPSIRLYGFHPLD